MSNVGYKNIYKRDFDVFDYVGSIVGCADAVQNGLNGEHVSGRVEWYDPIHKCKVNSDKNRLMTFANDYAVAVESTIYGTLFDTSLYGEKGARDVFMLGKYSCEAVIDENSYVYSGSEFYNWLIDYKRTYDYFRIGDERFNLTEYTGRNVFVGIRDGYNVKMYINGQLFAEYTDTNIFNSSTGGMYITKGATVCSIRLHDRPMTEDEVMNNWTVDRARFLNMPQKDEEEKE